MMTRKSKTEPVAEAKLALTLSKITSGKSRRERQAGLRDDARRDHRIGALV